MGVTEHWGYLKREGVNRLTSYTSVRKYVLNKNTTHSNSAYLQRDRKCSQGTMFPQSTFFPFYSSNFNGTSVLFYLLTSWRLVLHLCLILFIPLRTNPIFDHLKFRFFKRKLETFWKLKAFLLFRILFSPPSSFTFSIPNLFVSFHFLTDQQLPFNC